MGNAACTQNPRGNIKGGSRAGQTSKAGSHVSVNKANLHGANDPNSELGGEDGAGDGLTDPLEEEVVGPPFEEVPFLPVGEVDPPLDDVLGDEPIPPELESYSSRAERRNGISAPPFDMNEALSYVPLALGKREDEFPIIQRVFAEHALFRTLEPEILRVLMNAMEREEVLPGAVICQPRRVNEHLVILCRGSLSSSPNPHYTTVSRGLPERICLNSANASAMTLTNHMGTGNEYGDSTNDDAPLFVEHDPGVALFSSNLLYPSLPSHIVRAGENGATTYRLSMECFKNVMAKMSRHVSRRQVTLLGVTIISNDLSNTTDDDDDDGDGDGDGENRHPVGTPLEAESITMPSEEYVVAHQTEADVPLSLFPVSAVGLAAVCVPGEETVWDQTQTALLTYVFPVERRVTRGDTHAAAVDEMTDAGVQRATIGVRKRWRRHAVVSESIRVDDQFRPTPFEKTPEEREMLLRVVKSMSAFAVLSPQRQLHVVDVFQRRVIHAGETATHEFHWIERGTMLREQNTTVKIIAPYERFVIPGYGDPTMFSLNGSKTLSVSGGMLSGYDVPIPQKLGPGDSFGRRRIYHMHNSRVDHNPPLRAAPDEDAVLWTLCRTTLRRIFIADALRTLWKRLRLMRNTPSFSSMSQTQLLRVATTLIPVTHTAGTMLLRSGGDPSDILLIDTGTVEATIRGGTSFVNNVAAHVHFVGHGQCVGAAETFNNSQSPLDYRAHSAVTAYRLSRFTIPRIFDKPTAARVTNTAKVLVRNEQNAQIDAVCRERQETLDVESDSGSECTFTDDMCPVEIKEPEDNAFLQEFLSKRAEYAAVPPMYRGLAVAAFSAQRIFLRGAELFAEPCPKDANAENSPTVTKATSTAATTPPSPLMTTTPTPTPTTLTTMSAEAAKKAMALKKKKMMMKMIMQQPRDQEDDFLFVIRDGAVELTSAGAHVACLGRGFSVGEERLMRRRGTDSSLTAKVITDTCAVHLLDRKSFRRLLMPTFLAHTRALRLLLAPTPLSSLFGRAALAALGRRVTDVLLEPASVVLAHGCAPRGAFVLMDGFVDVTRGWDSSEICATLSAGDVIGGIDIMRKKLSAASYTVRSRARAIFIPVDVFEDSFLRFDSTVAFLRELQQSQRYAFLDEEKMGAIEREETAPFGMTSVETVGMSWAAGCCIQDF